ncbi:hypothetical protein CANARDRAFT_160523 [[Candida] arabinofermentans NRRL YB-2248]|uniref:Uncharacterized protein n=1 Tax=[Candida] arabinofermentans NRRL YB-2248 TaxID=983967 RepID=A0A1E4T0D5_9ASCO|nr:hypothetical protein CANARDRAFT_160523 [[Candida] arabinofermentans NRRL YB-2248]
MIGHYEILLLRDRFNLLLKSFLHFLPFLNLYTSTHSLLNLCARCCIPFFLHFNRIYFALRQLFND